jgi:hypothetical protein
MRPKELVCGKSYNNGKGAVRRIDAMAKDGSIQLKANSSEKKVLRYTITATRFLVDGTVGDSHICTWDAFAAWAREEQT